jgi:uncharacterized cupin superfamily protein
VSEPVNLDELTPQPLASDPPGYRNRAIKVGPVIGAEQLAATLYELPPGQAVCPYHYEYPHEEWLLVLDGHPVVRTPQGTETLDPGDVVCFPEGPEGAHKVGNESGSTVRILFLSTGGELAIAIYPDSGKVGVWPPGKLFRESDAVDYWDGE